MSKNFLRRLLGNGPYNLIAIAVKPSQDSPYFNRKRANADKARFNRF